MSNNARARLFAAAAPAEAPRRGAALVRWLIVLMVLGGAGYGGRTWWRTHGRAWWQRRANPTHARATYEVTRGDLSISIIETGNLKALRSEIISCKVEGRSTIISLVAEGTRITQDDIAKGRILVELDSADFRERLTQQEITHATAKAAYTQAKEAYEIQKSQGESNVNQSKLNVKFRRMDLARYIGETLARRALEGKIDLLELARTLHGAASRQRTRTATEVDGLLKEINRTLREAAENRAPDEPSGRGGALSAPAPFKPPSRGREGAALRGTFGDGLDKDLPELGGTGRQTKRKLEGDIDLVIERFKRAADKLIWTAKLESMGYVSHNELEADQLAVKTELINLEQALDARDIFVRYEFPKQVEELVSLHEEEKRELVRVEARARSILAQKEADRVSKEATYRRQVAKLAELRKQVDFCTIRAKHPGIVVYASSVGRRHYRSSSGPIEMGATVHERQELIRLPDISSLAVSVGIHESAIGKVHEGLPAEIRINALPNTVLKGKVHKVAVLPTSQRWWNPDLKEYDTEITIDGDHPNLKPGMSARVEVNVRTLTDVLVVPVQAVAMRGGRPVAYRFVKGNEVPTPVVLGESNDRLVEIRTGLSNGDIILLEAPQTADKDDEEQAAEPEPEERRPGTRTSPGQERPRPPGRPAMAPAGSRPPGARPGTSGRRPKPSRPGTGQPSGRRRRPSGGRGARPARRSKAEATD